MYIEIYKNRKLVKRTREFLSTLSWSMELMDAPSLELSLPIEYLEYFDGREEVKVFANDKVFWGIVWDHEPNKADETLSVSLRHVISEWEYRQISVNRAMKDKNLNVVYKGDKVEKDKENDEAITAHDFTIFGKNVKKLTDEYLINKAYASAWVISNGNPVDITKVDRSKIKKKEAEYDVTFSTAKGTSITVKCTVQTEITYGGQKRESSKANNETIAAYRFDIDIEAAQGLDADDMMKLVKPEAWVRYHTKQKVAVTTCDTNFQPYKGTYYVEVGTAKGTKVRVNIKVMDEGPGTLDDPAIVDNLLDIYSNDQFVYPGWEVDIASEAETEMIDYVYSRQNKLEALTKTCELTPDLFWRVGNINQKVVQIGKFGEKKPYIVSLKPAGETNIQILEEPTLDYDYENVINVATVYSQKSDSGMSSLTLREVYNDTKLQDEDFPVVILRENVNNERDYRRYITQYPELAPNNELEYAVLDVKSIALESGTLIEGTFAFNDLGSFNIESKRIKNEQRIKAGQQVYKAAIRKLKESRRTMNLSCTVSELPPDLMVGDRVRLIYSNSIWNLEACSNYYKKILDMDDWFYITSMEYSIEADGTETDRITLSKWMKIDRETQND